MPADTSDPLECFETWLLHRIAQAVEPRKVSADLLAEPRAEFEAAKERPQEQSHVDAWQDIAVEVHMPIEKVKAGFAELETQPGVVQEVFLRRIAEAWLEGQGKVYRPGPRRSSRRPTSPNR